MLSVWLNKIIIITRCLLTLLFLFVRFHRCPQMMIVVIQQQQHQQHQQRIQQNVLASNVFQANSPFSFEPRPISSITNTGDYNIEDDEVNQQRLLQSLGNAVRDSEEVFTVHFNMVDNNVVMNTVPSTITLPNNKERNNSMLPVRSSSNQQHQQQVPSKKRTLFLEEQRQPTSFPFSSLSNPTIQPPAKKQCNRTKTTMNDQRKFHHLSLSRLPRLRHLPWTLSLRRILVGSKRIDSVITKLTNGVRC